MCAPIYQSITWKMLIIGYGKSNLKATKIQCQLVPLLKTIRLVKSFSHINVFFFKIVMTKLIVKQYYISPGAPTPN